MALLYVTTILAQRLDAANELILEIKRDLEHGKRPGVIAKALDKLEDLFIPRGTDTSLFGHHQIF